MANVLPLEAQKKVARMHRARFVIALSLAIAALACILALSLLPSYLALSLASPPERESTANRIASQDARTMSEAQALVSHLHTALAATSSPSAFIALAMQARPESVRIGHITYTAPQGEKPAALQIVGNASREKIASFRDALVAEARFANVAVPVAALVGNASGDFSITLSIRDVQRTF